MIGLYHKFSILASHTGFARVVVSAVRHGPLPTSAVTVRKRWNSDLPPPEVNNRAASAPLTVTAMLVVA